MHKYKTSDIPELPEPYFSPALKMVSLLLFMQSPADRYVQSTQMGLVLTQKAARSKTFCLADMGEHLNVAIFPVGGDMNTEDWFLNPFFLMWETGLECGSQGSM